MTNSWFNIAQTPEIKPLKYRHNDIEAITAGNASLLIRESNIPILASDPWFEEHSCYFGSWRMSHAVPAHIKNDISNSRYIFISHGHPDHLNLPSLKVQKKINYYTRRTIQSANCNTA